MRISASRTAQTVSGLSLLLALAGCVGYVQGDGGVAASEPDFFWFGGYGDGGDARGYGHRGEESRRTSGRSGGAHADPSHTSPANRPAGRSGGAPIQQHKDKENK